MTFVVYYIATLPAWTRNTSPFYVGPRHIHLVADGDAVKVKSFA